MRRALPASRSYSTVSPERKEATTWAGSMLVKATEVGTPCSEGRGEKTAQRAGSCPGTQGPHRGRPSLQASSSAPHQWGSPEPSLTASCGEGTEASWAAAAGVPDADGAIGRAGSQALGGGAEGQAPHCVPMALQDVAEHAWVWASPGRKRAASGPPAPLDSPGALTLLGRSHGFSWPHT